MSASSLKILKLGRRPYHEVWELQKTLQQQVISKLESDTLILTEHYPVITMGTSAKPENLLIKLNDLKDLRIDLVKVERGGDITYHGPGQLIAYPIIDLHNHRTDVGWYMRSLEQVAINTLKTFDIQGLQIPGRTGVWIDDCSKICSIGVRLSRWVSMHGLSLNIERQIQGYSYINPCGFKGIKMVSMGDLNANASLEEVQNVLILEFLKLFKYSF